MATARQPVECLHADPDPSAARCCYLEPGMDWLVVVGSGRSGSHLDAGEPTSVSRPPVAGQLASRAVLGEDVWARRKESPVPARHRVAPLVLGVVSAAGVPFLVWGLIVLDPWITVFGLAVQTTGKLWFIDRMALLYDDVSPAAEEASPRTGR